MFERARNIYACACACAHAQGDTHAGGDLAGEEGGVVAVVAVGGRGEVAGSGRGQDERVGRMGADLMLSHLY